jgi:ribosomal protein S27AE
MTEWKRNKCPKCGEENPKKLHETPDKSQILYYSMQGTPVYKNKIRCGSCGEIFGNGVE